MLYFGSWQTGQGRGDEGVEGAERMVRADSCPKADSPLTISGQEIFQGEFQGCIDRRRGYMHQQHSSDGHLEISHRWSNQHQLA